MIRNHGHQLAFYVTPGRLPAIVLDSGGGLDASYWKNLVSTLAKDTGSEITRPPTLAYAQGRTDAESAIRRRTTRAVRKNVTRSDPISASVTVRPINEDSAW